MKSILKKFFFRYAVAIICTLFLAIILVLELISVRIINELDSQQMVKRWGKDAAVSQVSCFFGVNNNVTTDSIKEFEHKLQGALTEASLQPTDPSHRVWVDAYSARGTISVESDRGSINVDAIGIGGDFFLFHPLLLKSGSYFSGNDLMQDYCVLDEEAAWKLFGSNDIAGQTVTIGNKTHVVTGVIEYEEGKWYEKAGLENSLIYVSYESLQKFGTGHEITHYEILMPNPVKGYALNYVTEHIGVKEEDAEIVENSTRYSLLNRIKHIEKLTSRAINSKAVVFPYWENVARVYEDRLARIMQVQLILAGFVMITSGVLLIQTWKRNKGRLKKLIFKGKEYLEEGKLFQRKKKRLQQEVEDI